MKDILFDGDDYKNEKWYDFEDDFKAFAERNPNISIVVGCEGEESGDIWRAYAQDGNIEIVRPRIVLDEPKSFK